MLVAVKDGFGLLLWLSKIRKRNSPSSNAGRGSETFRCHVRKLKSSGR